MKREKTVTGMVCFWTGEKVRRCKREITIGISDKGKTMSVTDEKTDFKITIPLEPIEEMLGVVRCKDCKHNMKSPEAGNACCDIVYGMTDQYGFCHMGEKRGESDG